MNRKHAAPTRRFATARSLACCVALATSPITAAAPPQRDWDPDKAAALPAEPTDYRRPIVARGAAAPPGSLAGRVRGKAELTCDSQWHKLKLDLRPRGPIVLGADALAAIVRPPDGQDDDAPWTLQPNALEPLARDLAALPWLCAPGDAEAYARFQGQEPSKRELTVEGGTLTVTPARAPNEGGRPGLDLAGTIEVLDAGFMANRYGPNTWRDKVAYRVNGRIELDDAGNPAAFRLNVTVTVDGEYQTPGKPIREPYRQHGTFVAGGLAARPLTPDEGKAVHALILKLADADRRERDRAYAELLRFGERAEAMLREMGLNDDAPEVRAAVKRLLADLLSGELPEDGR